MAQLDHPEIERHPRMRRGFAWLAAILMAPAPDICVSNRKPRHDPDDVSAALTGRVLVACATHPSPQLTLETPEGGVITNTHLDPRLPRRDANRTHAFTSGVVE